ncbi:MAG: tetratricopeptide repeat protein [Terriglobales bacterium]|jgi:TPR repeat protein
MIKCSLLILFIVLRCCVVLLCVVLLCFLLLVCGSPSAQDVNQITAKVQSLKPEQIPALITKAKSGDVESQVMIGLAYRFGRGVEQNLPEAAKWLRKASKSGSASAANDLGVMYQYGNGVPQDDPEAAKLFRKAAELGNAPAQANLGFMYLEGRGVSKNLTTAFEWTQRSADQGYVVGEMNLGILYLEGKGTTPDPQKGIEMLKMAAEHGLVEAQGRLALAYLGVETPEGDAAALKWLSTAAEHGDKKSSDVLGFLHGGIRAGLNISSSDDLAALRLKGEGGDPEAQNLLSILYATSNNQVSAYFWFGVLADNSRADAATRKHAKDILKLMPKGWLISKEQIAGAETRLREWQASHSSR